jgi:hypothetical protein
LQLRVPAGNTGGGQWTSEGGGDASTTAGEVRADTHTADPHADDRQKPIQVASADTGTMDDALHPATESDWRDAAMPEGVDQMDSDAFKAALAARADLTDTERYAFLKTFGWEGGMVPNTDSSKDGISVAGLTAGTLPGLKVGVTDPRQLTVGQVVSAYKAMADAAMRSALSGDTLDDLGDRQTAAQFFDVYFQHGTTISASIVQNGVNEAVANLPTEVRESLGIDPIALDGQLGAATRDVIEQLDDAGYGPQLRAEIANLREAYFKEIGWWRGNNILRTYGYP